MITSLAWIPRGAARSQPLRFELSPEEYKDLKKIVKNEEIAPPVGEGLPALNSELEDSSGNEDEDDGMEKGDLDDSKFEDVDSDEEDENGYDVFQSNDVVDDDEAFDVMEYGDAAFAVDVDDEDDEDLDDDAIKTTDSMLAVAISDEDYSHLEVHLYTDDGTLFVHHDIILPDMPLSLAWMDCPPFRGPDGAQTEVGNYIAVGTMSPAIEIWNLDVMDPLEPTATLGGILKTKKKKNKTKGKGKKGKSSTSDVRVDENEWTLKTDSHADAVMALSWNSQYRQALASGSADNTVKVWDVTTQACLHTFTHHTDKVQAVAWHPNQAWNLATGSYDKSITCTDCRNGQTAGRGVVTSDVEKICWDPTNQNHLYVSLENGDVCCFDVRNMTSGMIPQLSFQAHDEACTSLHFSPLVSGMMVTGSSDEMVKVWDMHAQPRPKCIAYKTMGVGGLFAANYFTNEPYLLAAGGRAGIVGIWESDSTEVIAKHFEGRVVSTPAVSSIEDGDINNDGMEVTIDTTTRNGSINSKKKKKSKK
jgi:periodic tryptophan protein 1